MFDAALVESLAAIPDGPAETDGIAVGEAAGWGTLALRQGDGSQSGPLPPMLPPGPGVWAPTPPNTVRAGAVAGDRPAVHDALAGPVPPGAAAGARLRSLPPRRSTRSAASAARRRRSARPSRRRSPAFWADQPIAQGQRTLRRKAEQLGWDLAATARLFAAVMTSQADAIIACWDAKYTYQFWRPWQSVPVVEPGWTPLLATPNHPEFPSAHGCVTGSMTRAIADVMGTRHIELDIDALNIGETRHYATLDELLRGARRGPHLGRPALPVLDGGRPAARRARRRR